jgi:hypothetical protein
MNIQKIINKNCPCFKEWIILLVAVVFSFLLIFSYLFIKASLIMNKI